MTDKQEILNDPEKLKSLAAQLRAEADRAEVKSEKLKLQSASLQPGCLVLVGQCLYVQPI